MEEKRNNIPRVCRGKGGIIDTNWERNMWSWKEPELEGRLSI